jgi:hypothetical protein
MRAVARSSGWKSEVHHFLEATSSQRFAFDHDAIELLDEQALTARFRQARWLSCRI